MKYWEKPFGKEKPKIVSGEIHIIKERCKGCNFCIEYCPRDVLEVSEEFNEKGYHPPKVAKPEMCTFCGLCELICPDFAIFVTELKETPTGDHPLQPGTFGGKEEKIVQAK
ncbi:MAG: 4Fe-4S binding protein [Candidatus Cloacimonadota bacterium]|nr:4Fe-4S binding protein [Candidatus Cloacimonadota bacterium]